MLKSIIECWDDPLDNTNIRPKISNQITEEEKYYIKKRMEKVKKNVSKIVKDVKYV